ncbi:hypothetical protein ACHAXT_003349 [Thalassiosira profunda]
MAASRPPPDPAHDAAVIRTADDAVRAKLSCVEKGYYDDPFVHAMARGASGLVDGRGGPSSTEPIIRRGTHARVRAVDRAIDAFLALPLSPPDDQSAIAKRDVVRQVVILGAGRDTSYLRRRTKTGANAVLGDDVRWYEVDHPSVIEQKARTWLPRCMSDGYGCSCAYNAGTGCSYSVAIAPQGVVEESQYHLIGHDLRSSHDALFEKLANPQHGYDRSLPTLFVLECVLMYLPEVSTRELLSSLADSLTPSAKSDGHPDPFVAVAIYDPIPSNDRFGQVLVSSLQKMGIAGRRGQRGQTDDDSQKLGLEMTRTLDEQLAKVAECGFDAVVGCDMMSAYDHGVISAEDRRRAARCEMLDELEEFVLLMKHYCLLVGVCTVREKSNELDAGEDRSVGYQLCSVGEDSLMGFREGHCKAVDTYFRDR